MAKKKNKKQKIKHVNVYTGPGPKTNWARSSGNGGGNGGVGRGRVTIETPEVDANTVREIRNAATKFGDTIKGLVEGWATNGGPEKFTNNVGKSLRAVQGNKAIRNQPIDVEAFDDVSIDGLLLRPDEFTPADHLPPGYGGMYIWRNEEDFSVHLTVMKDEPHKPIVNVHSIIHNYTIAEAEHLAQMVLSACAFRAESEYKDLVQDIVSEEHKNHVHVAKGSIAEAFEKVMGDEVTPKNPIVMTSVQTPCDCTDVKHQVHMTPVMPEADEHGEVADDDDWDINGVQG